MPILEGTTKSSKKIWSGGDRTIWEVTLDVGGKAFKTKTYSEAIADEGFSGEMESYEKPGKYGSETFVRQAPKDKAPMASSHGPSGTSSRPSAEKFEMYLSYAKDILVVMQETSGYDKTKYLELLKAMVMGGQTLYGARPGAEPSPSKDSVTAVFGDEVEELDLDDVTDLPDPEDVPESLPLDL